jgi:hypothetical protein
MCANVLIVTVVMQHMDEAFVNCKYFFLFYNTCSFRLGFTESVMIVSPTPKICKSNVIHHLIDQKWPEFFKPVEPSQA